MTTVRLTYFDAAMTLIEINGLRLLTDPVLGPPGLVQNGPVQLEKTNPPPISPEGLGRIDAVLLSHDQHTDNFDEGGRALAAKARQVLTTPEAAERLGGPVQGLAPWQSVDLSAPSGHPLRITAVPAQHGPDGTLDATGTVTGFVLSTADHRARPVYISGDTIRFTGTSEIARRFAPVGLAVLHLGRAKVDALGDVALSLDAHEAALLADELRAQAVVPIHFEGWRHFSESRAEAEAVFSERGLAGRFRWMSQGQSIDFQLAT